MTTTSAFRHHDSVPPLVESQLFRQLITEWVALNAMASARAAVTRWLALEPSLPRGCRRPGDLVDAVDAATPEATDQILSALIRLFQDGHQLAGRVVLQSMLIKLGRMTSRTGATSTDNAWAEDRRHMAVAEFWDVLAHFPIARRTRKVAGNLSLDTLNRITRETRGPQTAVPVDTEQWLAADPSRVMVFDGPTPDPLNHGLSVDDDLVQVVTWAASHAVITSDEATLLVEVYVPSAGAMGTKDAAKRLGVSEAAIRQKCCRARRQLVAAVRSELSLVDQGAQSA